MRDPGLRLERRGDLVLRAPLAGEYPFAERPGCRRIGLLQAREQSRIDQWPDILRLRDVISAPDLREDPRVGGRRQWYLIG